MGRRRRGYDDDDEEEDYNAFDATPRQKSDKLSVSRVTRLTNHACWGMKMVNHHPSFFEHFEAWGLEIFYTWCVWQNQYYWTVQHTLYIAARNVLTRVCLELNRPQLFNAMLSNEVDSFQCSLNKGTAFLLSNEVETHELTDEEFWKPEPAYTLRFKQAKDTFLQIRSLQKKTKYRQLMQ